EDLAAIGGRASDERAAEGEALETARDVQKDVRDILLHLDAIYGSENVRLQRRIHGSAIVSTVIENRTEDPEYIGDNCVDDCARVSGELRSDCTKQADQLCLQEGQVTQGGCG